MSGFETSRNTSSATDATPTCKVVLAKRISESLLAEVDEGIKEISRRPVLVGFLASADEGARVYGEWTRKTALQHGFEFELRLVDREELEEHLIAANQDSNVDGIIVYYPIFGNRQDQYLQQIVAIDKDVEGLSHKYIFNMYQNIRYMDPEKTKKSIIPCTPLAVVKILEYLQIYNTFLTYGNRLHGRTITVINRSEVVGRPLAALLANDGACVYSVDIENVQQFSRGGGLKKRRHSVSDKSGWTLEQCLPLSDVVISGVPGDNFKVPAHLIREGACCINFSSHKNFSPDVKEVASLYVPAIGSVTIAVLLRNLVRIVKNRQQEVEPSAGNLTTIHENTSTEPLATPTLSTFNDPLQANGVAATAGKEPGGIQENAAVDSLTVTQYLSSSAHPLSKAQSDGQKDQTMTGYTGTLVDQTLLSQGEKPL